MGETNKAKRVLVDLEERSKEMHVLPYFVWRLHFVLDDHDRAYVWLEKAYEERDYFLVNLKTERTLEALGLNSDPRYISIFRKMNL